MDRQLPRRLHGRRQCCKTQTGITTRLPGKRRLHLQYVRENTQMKALRQGRGQVAHSNTNPIVGQPAWQRRITYVISGDPEQVGRRPKSRGFDELKFFQVRHERDGRGKGLRAIVRQFIPIQAAPDDGRGGARVFRLEFTRRGQR